MGFVLLGSSVSFLFETMGKVPKHMTLRNNNLTTFSDDDFHSKRNWKHEPKTSLLPHGWKNSTLIPKVVCFIVIALSIIQILISFILCVVTKLVSKNTIL